MSIHNDMKLSILNSLLEENKNEINQLNESLKLLCKWSSLLIINTYMQRH